VERRIAPNSRSIIKYSGEAGSGEIGPEEFLWGVGGAEGNFGAEVTTDRSVAALPGLYAGTYRLECGADLGPDGGRFSTFADGGFMIFGMTLSARNRLAGEIIELEFGGVMAHVVVRVGTGLIESVITKRSAEEMKLKIGDKVSAVIKSTEVMLEKS